MDGLMDRWGTLPNSSKPVGGSSHPTAWVSTWQQPYLHPHRWANHWTGCCQPPGSGLSQGRTRHQQGSPSHCRQWTWGAWWCWGRKGKVRGAQAPEPFKLRGLTTTAFQELLEDPWEVRPRPSHPMEREGFEAAPSPPAPDTKVPHAAHGQE